jgi:hypothetical protein
MNYAIYDTATGEIVSLQNNDLTVDGQAARALESFPADYIFLHYVVDGELELRPVSSVQIDGGVISFTNMHAEAACTITNMDGESMEFSPQDITLITPGVYYVEVLQPFPYSYILEEFHHA